MKKIMGSKRISTEQIFPIEKMMKRRFFFHIKNYLDPTAFPQAPQNLVVTFMSLPQ
jgi:hypothetical protein